MAIDITAVGVGHESDDTDIEMAKDHAVCDVVKNCICELTLLNKCVLVIEPAIKQELTDRSSAQSSWSPQTVFLRSPAVDLGCLGKVGDKRSLMQDAGVILWPSFIHTCCWQSLGKTPTFVVVVHPSQSERLVYVKNSLDLKSPNFTRTSMLTLSTATPDMTLPVISGRHLSKFEKKAEKAAADGLGSNLGGAAFSLAQPIGGLLVVCLRRLVSS